MGLVWQARRKLYGSLFFAFLHKKIYWFFIRFDLYNGSSPVYY